MFQQQLIHAQNRCISDDPECLPQVKGGTAKYHSTGHTLDHYQSVRGTSKVEAVHSVLDRIFYAQQGIGTEALEARLGWWILAYNRRRMRALGRKVLPDSMSPQVFACVCNVCMCSLHVCVHIITVLLFNKTKT